MHDRAAIKEGSRVTWVGFWANLGLIGLKLAAGVWGRSQALIADAAHSFSDLITDLVVLVGIRLGRSPADRRHPYGHGRVETLAALLVGASLAGAGVFLCLEAVRAILAGRPLAPHWLAPVAAAVSLVVKEALYRYTVRVGERIHSNALVANAWHHRSDALSSVAVLIGSGAAALDPAWAAADAYAAIVVSMLVLWAGGKVAWDAVAELIDTAPSPNIHALIEQCARRVQGVKGVHDLRVRLSGGMMLVEMHLEVDGAMSVKNGHTISEEVEACLLKDVDRVGQVMVHLDPV